MGGSPAGAPGLTAKALWVASRSPFPPLSAEQNPLTHSVHATHTTLPFTYTRG